MARITWHGNGIHPWHEASKRRRDAPERRHWEHGRTLLLLLLLLLQLLLLLSIQTLIVMRCLLELRMLHSSTSG
jgi:hypothetical protein